MKLFRSLRPATRESASPAVRRLQIFVLFSGIEATASALRAAGSFSADLGGDILIAAPLVVPYPLPLNCPSVNKRVLCAQIMQSISKAGITSAVHKVLIGYVRDRRDGWRTLLPQGCIVVVGKPKGLSPIQYLQTRLAAKSLRKLGHEVLVA